MLCCHESKLCSQMIEGECIVRRLRHTLATLIADSEMIYRSGVVLECCLLVATSSLGVGSVAADVVVVAFTKGIEAISQLLLGSPRVVGEGRGRQCWYAQAITIVEA